MARWSAPVAHSPAPTGGDDRAMLNAFLASLPAHIDTVRLRRGTYAIGKGASTGGMPSGLIIPRSNLAFEGAGKGATILDFSDWDTPGRAIVVAGGALLNAADPLAPANWITAQTVYPLQASVAKYAITVTLLPEDAANFAAGDVIFIRTGQLVAGGTREPDAEINEVLSVNTDTGVITLKWPTAKPYVQEFDTGDGTTSTGAGGTAASFGVSKMTDAVLRNIAFRHMTLLGHAGASTSMFHAQQVIGLTVEDCEFPQYDYSTLTARFSRDVRFIRNRAHRAFSTVQTPQAVGPSTGCTVWSVEDNVFTGSLARFHAHEGVAGLTVTRNKVICADTDTDTGIASAISLRQRAYDHRWQDNDFVGQSTATASDIVNIDANCTDGGILRGNRFRSPGVRYTLNLQGSGWVVEDNRFPDNWTKNVAASSNTLRRNRPKDLDKDAVYRAAKSADTARSSNITVADDPHLTVALPGVTRSYKVKALLIHDGDSAADMTIAFARPSGSTLDYVALAPNLAGSSSPATLQIADKSNAGTTGIGLLGAGTKSTTLIEGVLNVGNTAGSLTLQWAQQTSSATATTIYTGSYLEVIPMDVAA